MRAARRPQTGGLSGRFLCLTITLVVLVSATVIAIIALSKRTAESNLLVFSLTAPPTSAPTTPAPTTESPTNSPTSVPPPAACQDCESLGFVHYINGEDGPNITLTGQNGINITTGLAGELVFTGPSLQVSSLNMSVSSLNVSLGTLNSQLSALNASLIALGNVLVVNSIHGLSGVVGLVGTNGIGVSQIGNTLVVGLNVSNSSITNDVLSHIGTGAGINFVNHTLSLNLTGLAITSINSLTNDVTLVGKNGITITVFGNGSICIGVDLDNSTLVTDILSHIVPGAGISIVNGTIFVNLTGLAVTSLNGLTNNVLVTGKGGVKVDTFSNGTICVGIDLDNSTLTNNILSHIGAGSGIVITNGSISVNLAGLAVTALNGLVNNVNLQAGDNINIVPGTNNSLIISAANASTSIQSLTLNTDGIVNVGTQSNPILETPFSRNIDAAIYGDLSYTCDFTFYVDYSADPSAAGSNGCGSVSWLTVPADHIDGVVYSIYRGWVVPILSPFTFIPMIAPAKYCRYLPSNIPCGWTISLYEANAVYLVNVEFNAMPFFPTRHWMTSGNPVEVSLQWCLGVNCATNLASEFHTLNTRLFGEKGPLRIGATFFVYRDATIPSGPCDSNYWLGFSWAVQGAYDGFYMPCAADANLVIKVQRIA